MSFAPRFSITNAIAASLTRIERARGFLEAATLSERWISAMRSRALLLEAHHTTHIEGTRLTLDDAARLLAGAELPSADPDDARELLNYRRAPDAAARPQGPGRARAVAALRQHQPSGIPPERYGRMILRHSCAILAPFLRHA